MSSETKTKSPASIMAEKGSSQKSSSNDIKADEEEREKTSTQKPDESKNFMKNIASAYIPPWVVKNVTTPRSVKVLVRCWLASWVAFVIILPNASLNTLGTAAFFTLLCSFFLPPNLPVQLFLFLISTLVIGLLLAWGFGVAAMRAANASRSQALLSAAIAQVQNSIRSNPALQANPTLAQTSAVFHGVFLDTRSSAVYGCFLGFTVFLFALLRAYAPKLTMMSIFGTIAIDIYCSLGPLFPTTMTNLLDTLLKSVASYAALAVVLTVFVFPETMSHAVLRTICEQVERAEALIKVQEEVLQAKPGELNWEKKGAELKGKIVGVRGVLIGVQRQLMATSSFMALEFSHGKWSNDDVKDAIEPLLALVARVSGLQTFVKLVWKPTELQGDKDGNNDREVEAEDSADSASVATSSSSSSTSTPSRPRDARGPRATTTTFASTSTSTVQRQTNDTYLLTHLSTINSALELKYGVRVMDVLPVLEDSTKELRAACVGGLGCVREVLTEVNQNRWGLWWKREKGQEGGAEWDLKKLDEAFESLTKAREEYLSVGRGKVVEMFLPLLNSTAESERGYETKTNGDGEDRVQPLQAPLRTLFIANVFIINLLGVSSSILKLLEHVRATQSKRRQRRLWAPTEIRKAWKKLVALGAGRGGVEGMGSGQRDGAWEDEGGILGEDARGRDGGGGSKGHGKGKEERDDDFHLDPDSRPPTNTFQRVMNSVHEVYRWTKTPEAIFAFKYVFITIALWLPSVVRRTAFFYYEEKGVWALIMAQTTLNIYAADQIFNLITRLVGTFVGLVLGLVSWYMGNGHGIGNPYGAAAATGLGILPLIFVRLFVPQQYAAGIILTCATFALVVGYSWVDGHVAQFASPGIGWSVAWRRFTLVVIGSAASFIMMMLPPTSGRKAVRYRNASSIAHISDLYGFLISSWISKEDLMTSEDPHIRTKEKDGSRSTPTWLDEFRVRLLSVADEIVALRALTGIAKWEGSIRGKWPAEEYGRLVDVQSEMVSALAQLGSALSHLDDEWRIKFLHSTRVLNPNFITEVMTVFSLVSQSLRTAEPLHQVLPQSLIGRLFYHHHSHSHHHGHLTFEDITYERVSSVNYMYYAGGVVAVFQLLESLDELHQIVKRLCGEVQLRGFTDWRDKFDSSHAKV